MISKSASMAPQPLDDAQRDGFTPIATRPSAGSEMSPMLYALMVPIGGYILVATKIWKLVGRARTIGKAPRS